MYINLFNLYFFVSICVAIKYILNYALNLALALPNIYSKLRHLLWGRDWVNGKRKKWWLSRYDDDGSQFKKLIAGRRLFTFPRVLSQIIITYLNLLLLLKS